MIYKRGDTYWYKFVWKGKLIRTSTHLGNAREAGQIEAAERTRLAKGEVGIHEKEPCPTLKDFSPDSKPQLKPCARKSLPQSDSTKKLRRLLEDRKHPELALDAIDEGVIDGYKQRRTRQESRYGRALSPASLNRELATLRRLLRLAQEWKVLDRVPRIRLLRGERNREFVLSHRMEPVYLDEAPQPLKDVAILILECGVRPGEALALKWSDVYLNPAVHAKWATLPFAAGKRKMPSEI